MIKLEVKDYCQDCEVFNAIVEKKYEIGKGYIGCTITCSEIKTCEYGKKLCDKIEKRNEELDEFINKQRGYTHDQT